MSKAKGAAKVAGVVGSPIAQSLSPVMHGAWIRAAGLDAVYAPFETTPGGFSSFIQGLRRASLVGLNVTAPFKGQAARLADVRSQEVSLTGSANLLLFRGGRIEAHSTDGVGLIWALTTAGLEAPERAVIMGAGGAAAAALPALSRWGVREIIVAARRPSTAGWLRNVAAGVSVAPWEDLPDAVAGAPLLINATPMGLHGSSSPEVPLERMAPGAAVMDMVYRPLETPLLRAARAAGLRPIDGLDMLIGQGRPSFEALFGQPPDVRLDIRALLEQALAEATT